ncbi:MAG TPA: 2-amino-4-hydroxy-6-hydroxymethyldihydropteridine diphosphokinase [Solirubrobacteraceae bacterium]|nr:2-amino-4-hydroxy-6-hydroxymethyldihydropteridine diphosphokinase [Solirubrobacteraceae bacterium]
MDAARPHAPGEQRVGLLGLGCNLGERRAQLQGAVAAMPAIGVEVLACSSTYDTDPVGDVLEQPTFLNACVRVRTALAPLQLLDAVKRLERELGRTDEGVRHGPRTIDIDVLALGELVLAHERMVLPHEQLLTRRFVLIPALELDFELQVPARPGAAGFVRLSDALAALPVDEGVRWAGPPLRLPGV